MSARTAVPFLILVTTAVIGAGCVEQAPPVPAVPQSPSGEVVFASHGPDVDATAEMLIGTGTVYGLAHDLRDALQCEDQRADGRSGPHSCRLSEGKMLQVGGTRLRTALYTEDHVSGHADAYSHTEVAILLATVNGQLQPIHGLSQWHQDSNECFTFLLHQRGQVVDLDRDRRGELCVETSEEVGDSAVMRESDPVAREIRGGGDWQPRQRRRTIRAYRLDARGPRLVRAESLDSACPLDGYEALADYRHVADNVAHRATSQGGAVCPGSCPEAWRDSCGNSHFEKGAGR